VTEVVRLDRGERARRTATVDDDLARRAGQLRPLRLALREVLACLGRQTDFARRCERAIDRPVLAIGRRRQRRAELLAFLGRERTTDVGAECLFFELVAIGTAQEPLQLVGRELRRPAGLRRGRRLGRLGRVTELERVDRAALEPVVGRLALGLLPREPLLEDLDRLCGDGSLVGGVLDVLRADASVVAQHVLLRERLRLHVELAGVDTDGVDLALRERCLILGRREEVAHVLLAARVRPRERDRIDDATRALCTIEHAVVRHHRIALDEAVGDLDPARLRRGEDPAVLLRVALAGRVPHRAEVELAAVLTLDDLGQASLAGRAAAVRDEHGLARIGRR